MSARRIWLIVGSIAIVAILALGWFAAVSPVLAQAAINVEDRSAVAEQNAAHEATLAELQREYENIEELRSELDELAVALPAREAMPELIRQIGAAAAAAGAPLVGIKAEDVVGFVPAADAPVESGVAPPDATESSADEETAGETEPEVTDAPSPAVDADPAGGIVAVDPADLALLPSDRFLVIPVSIEVTGNAEQMIGMLAAVQHLERMFVVTGFKVEGGEPPKATISGYAYVLTDDTGVLDPESEDEPEPTETPAP